MKMKHIAGKDCIFEILGTGLGPVIICPVSSQDRGLPQLFAENLKTLNGTLVFLQTEDWGAELTPWPAPSAFGQKSFTGRGEATLSWLCDNLLPQFPDGRIYLAGYSLGGLFSLWAMLECDFIAGCASCSGSLWYPGWEEYLAGKSLRDGQLVYLSLGTHEERTRNPVMQTVGPNTRNLFARCQNQGLVTALEWNPGGHFKDPDQRLEKGIRWLLEHG